MPLGKHRDEFAWPARAEWEEIYEQRASLSLSLSLSLWERYVRAVYVVVESDNNTSTG